MTKYTNEWGKKGWPNTAIDPWIIDGKPVLSGWGNSNNICVTCCEVGETPTGNPTITSAAVAGDSGSISSQNPAYPYNNLACVAGSIADPNFGGHTGASGPNTENQTAIHPCRSLPTIATISDGLNSVASSLYTSQTFLGFASLASQSDVDDIDDAIQLCNNIDCIRPISNDYSYLMSTTLVTNACQQGATNNDQALYRLTGIGTSIEIENRQISGGGCESASDRYYACGLKDIGAWPGTTVSQGAGDSDVWHESSFVWTRDQIAGDGRRVGAVRYTITLNQTPYGAGSSSMNPLP